MSHPDYKDMGEPEDRLMEECAELIKAICKAKRFGWFECHPETPGITNLTKIIDEMQDVEECVSKFRKKSFKLWKGTLD